MKTKVTVTIDFGCIYTPIVSLKSVLIAGLIVFILTNIFVLQLPTAGNIIYTLFLVTLIVRHYVQKRIIQVEKEEKETGYESAVTKPGLLGWFTALNLSLKIGLVAIAICVLYTWSFSLYWLLSVISFIGLIGMFLWAYGIMEITIKEDIAC